MKKSLITRLSRALLACLLLVGVVTAALPASEVAAADCDNNAVIRCGVTSVSTLQWKYVENQGGNVQAIFAEFHIPNVEFMSDMVMGRVTKTNEVFVGNDLVATGAVTAGRQFMPGSVKMSTADAWYRNPAVSFRSESLPALVKMQNGRFHSAVILSCGNPVNAHPVAPPPAPAPQPTPQPKPTPKPGLEIQKDVRVVTNSNNLSWQQAVTANPNDDVQYKIAVKNTGETDLTNLRIQDSLPDGVSFTDIVLDGSQVIRGFRIADLVGEGITVPTLAKGGLIEIFFTVTVGADTDACEVPMRNVATAEADDVPQVDDDALVKVCQPEKPAPKPEVKAKQTPPAMPVTGAAGVFGAFSITSLLGFAAYKLKDFYGRLLG